MRGTSSRTVLVGICAWISLCLLVAGWIPELSKSVSTLWMLSGLMGLVSSVGLAETIKTDMRINQGLLEQYMQAALTDGLTGVANRQALDRVLMQNLPSVDPRSRPLSLIMLDIDHFKALNDQWGHQAGDAVLQQVAEEMTKFFHDRGLVARYGGEEFAIVAMGCRLHDADRLAEKFRQRIKGRDYSFQNQELHVTISLGVTEAQKGESAESIIRRADLALYTAKKMGRDCLWVVDSHNTPNCQPGTPQEINLKTAGLASH